MRLARPALPVLLVALGVTAGGAAAPVPAARDAEALRAALVSRCPSGGAPPAHLPCEELARLYGPEPRPLWWTPDGPSPQAQALAAALRGAGSRGLDPARYRAGTEATANEAASPDAGARARQDVALSITALRFVSDLALGRVAPREAGFELAPQTEVHDLAAHVAELARAEDLEAVLASIDPPFAAYRWLLAALARYRHLAGDPTLAVSPPAAVVHPGERLPEAPALRRHLAATGDLAAGAPPAEPDVYGEPLAAAVARFQRRHGLAPDGILGPATAAALAVPLASRARQIELALERFRWLPHRFAAPPVAVNIPEFRLYAPRGEADGYAGADDRLTMRVIVGRAWRQQTPVFVSEIRSVVFRPFWDVPASIARGEMLPRIRRDPGYLARERLDLVSGSGPRATVHPPSAANLERLAGGELRLRQRPGSGNALGLVKFLFPNLHQVYLHGTPTQSLFARERRDLSHGCIRVEDPLSLAAHVLRDEPGWTRERIAAATEGAQTREVRLTRPVPLYVLYVTALARADGSVDFFPDLYGLDARLEALLAAVPSDA